MEKARSLHSQDPRRPGEEWFPRPRVGERLQDWCVEKLAYFTRRGWQLFVEVLREDPRRRAAILALHDRKKRRYRAPSTYWTLVH